MAVMISRIGIKKALNYKKNESLSIFIVTLNGFPVLGPLFFTQSYWSTWIAIAIWGISWFLLYKTSFGLRLRACGEHPSAVASAGINVYGMRYFGVMMSGALAGLGGGIILVTYSGEFNG